MSDMSFGEWSHRLLVPEALEIVFLTSPWVPDHSASLVVICYLLKRESGARTAARPLGSTCACPSSKLISKAKAEAVFPPSDFFPPENYYLPGCPQWLMTCQHHSKHYYIWPHHTTHALPLTVHGFLARTLNTTQSIATPFIHTHLGGVQLVRHTWIYVFP